ncbi:hypothetical protein D018_1713A, partial [Vibrio parahaemolyticus VP2007-007]
MNNQRRHLY